MGLGFGLRVEEREDDRLRAFILVIVYWAGSNQVSQLGFSYTKIGDWSAGPLGQAQYIDDIIYPSFFIHSVNKRKLNFFFFFLAEKRKLNLNQRNYQILFHYHK